MQQRREVGVARQDDELVEVGLVREVVAHVHDHADVGRVLQLRGERRAVDDFEARPQEVVPHERKRVHVGGIVVLIAPRHGIAVAAVHHDAALRIVERCVGRRDQAAVLDLTQPKRGVLRETLSGFLALAFQRQVDVVVIDKHRAKARSPRLPLH